jgi:hypothetical protein
MGVLNLKKRDSPLCNILYGTQLVIFLLYSGHHKGRVTVLPDEY